MRNRDDGFALLWSLALAGALIIIGMAGLSLCALTLAHARAGNAADLAAIAAASNARDPCGSADRVAAANSAQLTDCAIVEGDVIVRVLVRAPAIAQWWGSDRLEVSSRAGSSTE